MLAMCSNKTWFYKLTATLTIIGGLNWGLHGFFDFDLVQALFSSMEMLPTIVYDLIGLSALYMTYDCLTCKDQIGRGVILDDMKYKFDYENIQTCF